MFVWCTGVIYGHVCLVHWDDMWPCLFGALGDMWPCLFGALGDMWPCLFGALG